MSKGSAGFMFCTWVFSALVFAGASYAGDNHVAKVAGDEKAADNKQVASKHSEVSIAEKEISALIQSVENSRCTFQRNGKAYKADEAADHLRLKWRRGKKYAGSAELFIENLASKSSWSGKPYSMDCPETGIQTTNAWFHRQLKSLRGVSVND
ncbi:hypothetical protein SAMN02745866_02535 [Alteromonadaceae bacterium Bs31]|nr:hypothetical protein SAMN02745866_02535 [Alteromonadaceae bacterium Bs31]